MSEPRPGSIPAGVLTGDEPHYLILTRSLFVHHQVDPRQAYRDAFQPGSFLNAIPPEKRLRNIHAVSGRAGSIFPVHGPGLSVLVAPGWLLGGVAGARATMVLLAGVAALTVALAASQIVKDQRLAALTAAALALGIPLLTAGNQIYPDLPSGTIVLAVFVAVMCFPNRSRITDGLLVAGIALLPWLHVKLLPVAALCALVLARQLKLDRRLVRAAAAACTVAASVAGVAMYNLVFSGTLLGPINESSSAVSGTAAMVLLGLHVDRAQGMLVLSPLLAIGAIEAVARLVGRRPWSLLFALTYAALVVPNALHPNWYGGASFAGRFGWAAALLLVLPTLLGLQALAERSLVAAAATTGAALAVQATFAAQYAGGWFPMLNKRAGTPLEEYPSLWGPLRPVLPALYDRDWAAQFFPNWVGLSVVLVLGAVGVAVGIHRKRDGGVTELAYR